MRDDRVLLLLAIGPYTYCVPAAGTAYTLGVCYNVLMGGHQLGTALATLPRLSVSSTVFTLFLLISTSPT